MDSDFLETDNQFDHVQRISLPWGVMSDEDEEEGYDNNNPSASEPMMAALPMIPVVYPKRCQLNPPIQERKQSSSHAAVLVQPPQPPPHECHAFMEDQILPHPKNTRFFVNISTHITWYRERGVLVYPIMVVRDPLLHFIGLLNKSTPGRAPKGTTTDTTPTEQEVDRMAHRSYNEYKVGQAIMVETIAKGLNPIVVSYETLMTLRINYLCHLYWLLGIDSDYLPSFKNGNTKYLQKQQQEPAMSGSDEATNGMDSRFEMVESELIKEDYDP